ncbi:putative transcriptional regulator YdeE [Paenibacillus cellulosilyticus]|uniref:Putative transcriptional regulator YdeE n=1 Tax=Paenibacillus cellulosilyticus TaxID=375489 RepID=A0A2V2YN84_9BACL|nr:GyrI-like domain-containing protein [Paenibacillus cellulosilyticus]PWV95856.1 putative transcriptional regulator YdeE [Paenibacillus cellulosilyticus]QKS47728.1 GyrI-like domain-containing protein [Paenibacillus cellulosilyticus]
MRVEIVETNQLSAYIGVRACAAFSDLGVAVNRAFDELISRRDEIKTIKNPDVTYGITPPNYKGNAGVVDFYSCFEVEPLEGLPHGMVHLHLLPRLYAVTYYRGPASQTVTAYDFTSQWLKDNGYDYDDVAYYLERYDEKTIAASDDERNEIQIWTPVKKR